MSDARWRPEHARRVRRLANRMAVARLDAPEGGRAEGLPTTSARFAVDPPVRAATPAPPPPRAATPAPPPPRAAPTAPAPTAVRTRRTLLAPARPARAARTPEPVPDEPPTDEPSTDEDRTATLRGAPTRHSLPPMEAPRTEAGAWFARIPWSGRTASRMDAPPVPTTWSAPSPRSAGAYFAGLPWGASGARGQGPEDNARGDFLAFATRAVLRASGADPALDDTAVRRPRAHTYFASLPWNGATP